MQPALTWTAVRAQFPALENWTYLNTATVGLISLRTEAAVVQHFTRRNALANTDFDRWWDEIDELRAAIAELLHGPPAVTCPSKIAASDIAFFPNACSALALARSAINWQSGDQIVTLEGEFPNLSFANATLPGVALIETPWTGLWDAIGPRTRLVAVSAVNYQTGLRVDWPALAAPLRARGILLYVDATQSFGALQTVIEPAAAPDIFAVDCYKWACAPPGAAFAYIHPELRARLDPAVIGWRSDSGWRDFANLAHRNPTFSHAAEKYEGGMLAFPSLSGLRASLDLIRDIGPGSIEQRVLSLARACGGDGTSPIVLLDLNGRDPSRIAAQLKNRRLAVSVRKGKLRVSPHFYNNEADIENLLDALQAF